MANNFRATASKRQRELDQKDRVKDREVRRAERRDRIQQRIAAGVSGAPIEELPPPEADAVDGGAEVEGEGEGEGGAVTVAAVDTGN